MKKFLIGTTALVAVGFAGSAAYSAGLTASVGGYMHAGVVFSDKGNDLTAVENDSVHILRDGEIHFNVEGTSDNGLTFKGRVELEAFTTTDSIDENWVSVGGAFGTVLIGGNDTALYNIAGAHGVSYVNGAINYVDSANDTTQFTPGASIDPVGQDDSMGIQYHTPTFAGFKLGVSYQPDSGTDGASDAQSTFGLETGDQYSVGLSYNNNFGDVSVGLGLGYMQTEGLASVGILATDTDTFYAGLDVGFEAFTASLFYQNIDRDSRVAGRQDNKADAYGLGLMYQTGPWTIGGGIAMDTREGEQLTSSTGTNNFEEKRTHGTVGVSYALAPGATVSGIIEAGRTEVEDTVIATGAKTSTSESGVAGAILLGLKF